MEKNEGEKEESTSYNIYIKPGNTRNHISEYYPIIAGLLIIISGILSILLGTGLLNINFQLFQVAGVLQLMWATIMIITGVLSILKKQFKIVVIGTIISMLIFIIPGLVALLLLFYCEDEFES